MGKGSNWEQQQPTGNCGVGTEPNPDYRTTYWQENLQSEPTVGFIEKRYPALGYNQIKLRSLEYINMKDCYIAHTGIQSYGRDPFFQVSPKTILEGSQKTFFRE